MCWSGETTGNRIGTSWISIEWEEPFGATTLWCTRWNGHNWDETQWNGQAERWGDQEVEGEKRFDGKNMKVWKISAGKC